MTEVSLKDFLTTGKIGPVTLGFTRRRVVNLLGEPDAVGDDVCGLPTIWKYGDIEMIFGAKGITLSLIDFHAFKGIPNGGKRIQLDPWILSDTLSRRSLEKGLKDAEIPFGLTDWNTRPWGSDDTVRLWCGTGIELVVMGPKHKGPKGFYGAFYTVEPKGWAKLK